MAWEGLEMWLIAYPGPPRYHQVASRDDCGEGRTDTDDERGARAVSDFRRDVAPSVSVPSRKRPPGGCKAGPTSLNGSSG